MKYIITEWQYRLLTEDRILKLDFDVFNNDWDVLQRFLERRGNPPYEIIGNLDLYESNIESLGNLQSVGGYLDLRLSKIESLGNLQSVGGDLDLFNTNIESLGNLQSVDGYLKLKYTPLSEKTTEEEIRNQVEVDGNIYL